MKALAIILALPIYVLYVLITGAWDRLKDRVRRFF